MKSWINHKPTFDFDRATPAIREASTWRGHFNFAYDLIRFIQPKTVVELGSYMGGSYFSMCQAVKDDKLDTQCFAIDTWEGDHHSGFYGDQIYQTIKTVSDSYFPDFTHLKRMMFDDALKDFGDETINILHIDGLHTYEAVKHDYDTWLPKLAPHGIILFHDTCERKDDFGVWKLWDELTALYPHLSFTHSHGLGVLFPKGVNEDIAIMLNASIPPLYDDSLLEKELGYLLMRLENDVHAQASYDTIGHLIKEKSLNPGNFAPLINAHVVDKEKMRNLLQPLFTTDRNKPTFTFYFPGFEDFHFTKDIGIVPYMMQKYHDYDAFVLTAGIHKSFPPKAYLNDRVPVVIGEDSAAVDAFFNRTDVLMLVGVNNDHIETIARYKTLRPDGKIYLKLDLNSSCFSDLMVKPELVSAIRRCDVITVEDRFLRRLLEFKFNIYATYLPNGFYDFFGEDGCLFEEKEHLILSVGRPGAWPKNTQLLLDVFAGIYHLIPDWKLVLVGEATQQFKDHFDQLCRVHDGLAARVMLTGALSYEEVHTYYKRAKIFCLTSMQEASANVIGEALGRGCAVISTHVDGALDLLGYGAYGTVVPLNEFGSFKQALLSYCNDDIHLEAACRQNQYYTRNHINWQALARQLNDQLKGIQEKPKTSIVILTYNNLAYNQGLLKSIRQYTPAGTYEVIMVDNNSTDGTREWLQKQIDIKVVLNDENVGFPKGCNIGIEVAAADYDILLLNNDIEVTHHWLDNLKTALYSDARIGAVAGLDRCHFTDATDEYGNRFNFDTTDLSRIHAFAKANNVSDAKRWRYTNFLTGYCMLIKRSVLDKVGLLDERFTPGNYEDDDLSVRIMASGHYLLNCYDAFIHHYGSVSFRKDETAYQALLRNNAQKFYDKWQFPAWDKMAQQNTLLRLLPELTTDAPRVLGYGVGLGRSLFDLLSAVPKAQLYGVEPSAPHQEVMKQLIQLKAVDEHLIPVDCEEGSFDLILIDEAFNHCPNPQVFLTGIGKLLKPGGHVLFNVKNASHISVIKNLLKDAWQSSDTTINQHVSAHFTGTDIRQLVTPCGFVDPLLFHWYAVSEEEAVLIDQLTAVVGEEWATPYRTYSYTCRFKKGYVAKLPTEVRQCSVRECHYYEEQLSGIAAARLDDFDSEEIIEGVGIRFNLYFKDDALSWIRPTVVSVLSDLHVYGNIQTHENVSLINADENLFVYKVAQFHWDYALVYQVKNQCITVLFWCEYFVEKTPDVTALLSDIASNFPSVMSTGDTLAYVAKNRASLTRFGDGELALALGKSIGFQLHSPQLQDRLLEILSSQKKEKLLVALPEFSYFGEDVSNIFGDVSVWEYFWMKHFATLKPYLAQQSYGNATVSRRSVFEENTLDSLKRIWASQDVVFVVGAGGRFELVDDLFDNVASSQVLEVPAVNAFDSYDDILARCLAISGDKLFIISCGPTATVLAYDLAQHGLWALDFGHLPNAYQQYLGLIETPESLPFEKGES